MVRYTINRRQLATGLVVVVLLASILPQWRYAMNLREGLRAHCTIEGVRFSQVTAGDTSYSVAAASAAAIDGATLCRLPAGAAGLTVRYGPDDADTAAAVTHAAASEVVLPADRAAWSEPPAFAASWFGAFLEVGGGLYAILAFAGALALVYLKYTQRPATALDG